MSGLKGAGSRLLLGAGSTPSSCSNGLKGVPCSKVTARAWGVWGVGGAQ